MSDGAREPVDCGEVLVRLSAYLDQEMSVDEREHFREHIDDCAPCLEELGIDQAVKAVVTKCCGGETAPDELRAKVVSQLRASWTTSDASGTTVTTVEETTVRLTP